ncbi:MAG: helicase [Bogoriella megaspora]|nr:MAG: helicase [Bogoriella megaspora]
MLNKPFKPPLLARKPAQSILTHSSKDEQPRKKRRISEEDDSIVSSPIQAHPAPVPPVNTFRKPLLNVANIVPCQKEPTSDLDQFEAYYTVLWRKFTTKKNKTWDGDGLLSVSGGVAKLQDISGRDMGKAPCNAPLLPGSTLSIGGKDIEVDSVISRQDFLAGKPFLGGGTSAPLPKAPTLSFKPLTSQVEEQHTTKADLQQQKKESQQRENIHVAASQSLSVKKGFKAPQLSNTVLPKKENSSEPIPRHDATKEGALVMKRPGQTPKGKRVVDVVVDPLLSKHLRDHQRQGVSFLYECTMGMKSYDGEGAILADEMGLGKTLQTIALLWTLLKQNPIYEDPPVIKKALIVCPATLINNWRKEFRKWLGNERIGVFVADDKKTRLTDFTMGKSYNVMVIGYEKLRSVQEDLKKGAGIDIVIADEGHRLKTAQNKSALAIKSLNTERRIILSGTPIQNDLSEFFTMVDFVNPGLLGRYNTFKREFEAPILKSRQPEATAQDIEKGEARSEELASLTGQFILRRTAEILSQYLPPKTEYILFCKPTAAQADIYRTIISSPAFSSVLGSPEASLQLISILKKVCNSPSLLKAHISGDEPSNPLLADMLSSVPKSSLSYPGASAKLQVLDNLLHHLRTTYPDEKVVLASNWTTTLDMLGTLLTSLSYSFLRLDGSTPSSQRQSLVERFNHDPASRTFAFLLSAKSGGMGINLIGASRLVLFDADWNPATDAQAMARIHRDGQKRPVRIYRLLLKGAMDEKIFQRQGMKMGLADAVVDGKKTAQGFSREELRDLFRLEEGQGCRTHELLGCECSGRGGGDAPDENVEIKEEDIGEEDEMDSEPEELPDFPALMKASEVNMDAQEERIAEGAKRARSAKMNKKGQMQTLMQYKHFDTSVLASGEEEEIEAAIEDDILIDLLKDKNSRVDFMFSKKSGLVKS